MVRVQFLVAGSATVLTKPQHYQTIGSDWEPNIQIHEPVKGILHANHFTAPRARFQEFKNRSMVSAFEAARAGGGEN